MNRDRVLYVAGDRGFKSNELGFTRTQLMSFKSTETDGEPSPAVSHPYLTVMYFYSGNGVFETGGKEYVVRTHDMIVLNRDVPYKLSSEISNIPLLSYVVMAQNFRILNRDVDTIATDGFINYSHRSPDNEFRRVLAAIEKELTDREYSYHTKMSCYFTIFIADIIRLFTSISDYTDADGESPFKDQMQQAKNEIDRRCLDPAFDLTEAAHNLGIIKRELLLRFKDVYHVSAVRYLDSLRLDHAKRLLGTVNKSLDEIAALSGFESEKVLCRTYQRLTGTMLKSRLEYEKSNTEFRG